MRGIYNADFKVDVLPQAALRLHAVNCTQPLQGCITTGFLLTFIPNSRSIMACDRYAAGVWVVADRKLRSACMRS